MKKFVKITGTLLLASLALIPANVTKFVCPGCSHKCNAQVVSTESRNLDSKEGDRHYAKNVSEIGYNDNCVIVTNSNSAEKELASNFAENSKAAILIDAATNTIIFEKNSQDELPIASMTKMMSLSVVFDAIDSKKLDADGKIFVSENAAATEGSQAFLDANKAYNVSDLIKSVIIASANDSTVALAESVAGSEGEFVRLMNKKARELGLKNTHFANSTGLPAPEHYSSAYDCAIIYKQIMDNPLYVRYSKIWLDELVHPSGRKTELTNTNRLVKTYPGCDSGKTGYTSEAKYCLTCSARRGDLRLISVVIGEPDSKTRFSEVTEMFNYGFANYANNKVVDSLSFSVPVKVKGAKISEVTAKPERDFYNFSKKGEHKDLDIVVTESGSRAPVREGDVVGKLLIISDSGEVVEEINLLSSEYAPKQTILDCLRKIISQW